MGLEWGGRRRRRASRPVIVHDWLPVSCGAHLCARCGLVLTVADPIERVARYRCEAVS